MQRRIGKEYVDFNIFKNNMVKCSLSCCLDKNDADSRDETIKGGKFLNIAVKKMEKDKEMEDE